MSAGALAARPKAGARYHGSTSERWFPGPTLSFRISRDGRQIVNFVTAPTKANPYGMGQPGHCGGILYGRNETVPKVTIGPTGAFFGKGITQPYHAVTTISGSFKSDGRTASGTIRFRSAIAYCQFTASFRAHRA